MKPRLVVMLCLGVLAGCGGVVEPSDAEATRSAFTEEGPPPDEGRCNQDGVCDPEETHEACPLDCDGPVVSCGDGVCDAFETHQDCPADCDG